MVRTVKVPEKVAEEIQEAHVKADALRGLVESLVEKHAQDADSGFTESPVFKKLLDQYVAANAHYESKKELVAEYIPDEEGYAPGSWSLSYATAELSMEYGDRKVLRTV